MHSKWPWSFSWSSAASWLHLCSPAVIQTTLLLILWVNSPFYVHRPSRWACSLQCQPELHSWCLRQRFWATSCWPEGPQTCGWISSSHWMKIWKESQISWLSKRGSRFPSHTHTLQRVGIAVLTMFGSMYACEQYFSHLNNINNNLRSHLTERSFNACMNLNFTTYKPDYKAIRKTIHYQKLH